MPYSPRRPGLLAAFGLVTALAALPAPAQAVGQHLDLATMTERAGTIVSGRITELRSGSHPKYKNVGVLFITLKVNEMIKGAPAQTFTFMQFTGRATQAGSGKPLSVAQSLPHLPMYRVGEEVVLFLYPPSSVGFTSPVGGEQGKFIVQRSPGHPVTLVSEAGNAHLVVEGPLPAGLTPEQQRLLRSPGRELDLKTFRGAVKRLAKPVR
jgi:hypothetical protein